MAIGHISQSISIDASFRDGASAGLRDLRATAEQTLGDRPKGLGGISRGARLAIAGLATSIGIAGLRGAFEAFSDAAKEFDSEMSNVKAISGATGDEFEALRELALNLGSTTAFDAKSAAEGMSKLAMAGLETNEILGAMKPLLDAAKAGSENLAFTADFVSNVVGQFNLDVEEIEGTVDTLVQTTTTSNTTLRSLEDTFKFVGPVAESVGEDLHVVAAAAGILGSSGIQGSMAGTALRSMFLKLSAPTNEAREALEKMEVTLRDANGELLPLPNLVHRLKEGLKQLDPSEQSEAMKKLIGEEGMSGFQILLDAGPEKIAAYAASLTPESAFGAAMRVAQEQADNLKGSNVQLESAWEGLKITIGEVLNPALKILVDEGLTPTIRSFDDLFKSMGKEEGGDEVKSLEETIDSLDTTVSIASDNTANYQQKMTLLREESQILRRHLISSKDSMHLLSENVSAAEEPTQKLATATGSLWDEYKDLTEKSEEAAEATEATTESTKTYFKEIVERPNIPLFTDDVEDLTEEMEELNASGEELAGMFDDLEEPIGAIDAKMLQISHALGETFIGDINDFLSSDSGWSMAVSESLLEAGQSGDITRAAESLGVALASTVGGPLGGLLASQLIGPAMDFVSGAFGTKGRGESREDVIAEIHQSIGEGDLANFSAFNNLLRTLDNAGSARITANAIATTFGLSFDDAVDLINIFRTLKSGSREDLSARQLANLERFNEELGAVDARAQLERVERSLVKAQHGFSGVVSRDTTFRVAEAGHPEHVQVTPINRMGSGSDFVGGGSGPSGNFNFFISTLDARGMRDVVESEIMPMIVDGLKTRSRLGDNIMHSDGVMPDRAIG